MKSLHPALSPGRSALLRLCPDAPHVELEALEFEAVLGAALDRLRSRGDQSAGEYLAGLPALDRLPAALAAIGQCLQVPVKVRGGACDRKGLGHPGNGMGALLGLLAGREASEPYTGRGTVALLARAREKGTVIRSAQLRDERWTETRRDGTQVQRRRKFARSMTYIPAAHLRRFYRAPQLAALVTEMHRLCPPAWRVAARWRRCSRGYWGAIRRSRSERVSADNAARRRAAFAALKARTTGVRISKTEGENSSRAGSQPTVPDARTIPAGAGRGGAKVETLPVGPTDMIESDPQQGKFRDRLAAEGLDVARWESQPEPAAPSRVDARRLGVAARAPSVHRGAEPWARYLA